MSDQFDTFRKCHREARRRLGASESEILAAEKYATFMTPGCGAVVDAPLQLKEGCTAEDLIQELVAIGRRLDSPDGLAKLSEAINKSERRIRARN